MVTFNRLPEMASGKSLLLLHKFGCVGSVPASWENSVICPNDGNSRVAIKCFEARVSLL